MDAHTTIIQNKMSKIQASLLELNNEILTGVRFLLSLKETTSEIVEKLNCITTSATFLQEFTNVNSFILRYLSFVTEMNCKFEMLNISEKDFRGAFSGSKAISSADISDILHKSNFPQKHEVLKDKIVEEINIIDKRLSESDTTREPLQAKSLKKKLKDRKRCFKKTVKVSASRKKSKTRSESSLAIKTACNSKKADDIDNKSDCTFQLTDTEENDLILESESTDIVDKQVSDDNHCDCSQLSEIPSGKESNSMDGSPELKENMEKCFVDVSCSTTNDTNIPVGEITGSGIHSGESIPVAEIVPMKIQTRLEGLGAERAEDQNSKPEDEADEEDCIKPEDLPRVVGKEYDIIMEYIKSPSEFYVSIIGEQPNLLSELENLLKLIPLNKSKVDSRKCEKFSFSKEIGTYALFYSKCDEIWCRVKITNWCLNSKDNFVTAFLLDSGETKCVSVDDLRPMPECFKMYPASVHRCHLQGIIPADMDEKNGSLHWGRESGEKMKFLIESSKRLKIKLGPNDRFHPSTSLPVTLWSVDDNQCVNQLLVNSKHAKWGPDQSAVDEEDKEDGPVGKNFKDWDPMKEDFESYLNSYDLDLNDPAAVIYGYVGNDYKRICRHFADTGFCFKGISCRKEHKQLDPLGFTTDEEEVYKNAFNTLPSPPPKAVLNVQVTCLLKLNQFYCVSETNKVSSSEENLLSLLNYMNAEENIRDMKKLLIPPSAGQIVIARYSEDGYWYRARILESQPEKDVYAVVFMDYGNQETMPLSDIRAIEPRYLHLPFQAMKCFIFGIDANPKVSFTEVMDYMNDKINDRHITIEVVACLPGDCINLLVNVFDQNGRNIGKDLIEMGYAVNKEEIVISAESERLPG